MAVVVEVFFTAHPRLIFRQIFKLDQVILHHSGDFEKALVLVDARHVEVSMKMRIITHLVFHGAPKRHPEASGASHRLHIMSEDVLARLFIGIAVWAGRTHVQTQ